MSDQLLDHLRRALGDTFSIERELIGGGMSRVFVARERALGREVVIKVLPKELALGVNRERFQQEVQLAARLSHPYIVTLLHAGEHEDLLWFTMPFISGESLKAKVEAHGPLSVRDTVRYSRDVVEALAYAHAQGVIHRDIKPANILVDGGHALVTDFGVAKALSAAMPMLGRGHTTTGMAIGTPAYMAPEQLAADPDADHRVDIYAMGLLMYELLAGTSPFSAPSPTATMAAQLTQMPQPIEKVRPDVPPALAALITRCLAKNPAERPESADAILLGLDQVSGEMAAAAHRSRASRLVQRMVPVAAALVLVAVAATATVVYRNRSRDAAAPPVIDTPAPPAVTDAAPTVPISPTEVQPKTGEDSLRRLRALLDELERLDPSYAQRQQASAKPDPSQIAMLDSLVSARVDERLKASQAAMPPRPSQERTLNFVVPPPGGGGGDRRGVTMTGATIEPRKIVIETGVMSRRGTTVSDSMLRQLSEQIGVELTRYMPGQAFQIVRRTANGRIDPANDTAMADADALVMITLAPELGARDSVSLRMTVRNTAGGGVTMGSLPVFKPVSPDAFQKTINDARRLLYGLQAEPRGTPWLQGTRQPGAAAGDPPQQGAARGGTTTGRGGGGRVGGGPMYWQGNDTTGKKVRGGITRDSGGGPDGLR